jgi:hypothetical protein
LPRHLQKPPEVELDDSDSDNKDQIGPKLPDVLCRGPKPVSDQSEDDPNYRTSRAGVLNLNLPKHTKHSTTRMKMTTTMRKTTTRMKTTTMTRMTSTMKMKTTTTKKTKTPTTTIKMTTTRTRIKTTTTRTKTTTRIKTTRIKMTTTRIRKDDDSSTTDFPLEIKSFCRQSFS